MRDACLSACKLIVDVWRLVEAAACKLVVRRLRLVKATVVVVAVILVVATRLLVDATTTGLAVLA